MSWISHRVEQLVERGYAVLGKPRHRPAVDDVPSNKALLYVDPLTGRLRLRERRNGDRAVESSGGGTGDVVGPSSSVASEVALFDGTTGKLVKRASGTGVPTLASGVLSVLSAPSRVLGQGIEYDASGALGWRSAHDAIVRRWSVYYDSTIRTFGTTNAVISPGTSADATGFHATMNTSASAGSKIEHRDGTGREVYQPRHGAEIAWVVSPQHTTSVLYWCSSTSAQTTTPTGDTLAGHGVGFRHSTDAGDAGWTFCTRDGTTQNTTATGIAVTAGNVYVLVASTLDAGVTWRWRVYDVTAGTTATGTTTTNVPGTSTSLGWQYLVEARAASARSLWGYGLSGVHGARA